MQEPGGVLVVGEATDGHLAQTARELLNVGGSLARDLGQALQAVLLGSEMGEAAHEAVRCGAQKVLVAEHPALDRGQVEAYIFALQRVCLEVRPDIVLISRTELGRDLGPRLAFRLGAGLAQDAVDLRADPATGKLLVTRPVYGGNAVATLALLSKPQIVTVRPKVFEPASDVASIRGEAVKIPVEIPESILKTRLVERIVETREGIKLEEARVVVAGGRGLGGPEPFKQIEKLAKLLGGAFGASRPACDAGWVDHACQIGLTGKTVAPELYIAVAISGASQHIAGCLGAKVIVAINNDPDAHIFKHARYGAVGDWRKVLPAFIAAVEELLT